MRARFAIDRPFARPGRRGWALALGVLTALVVVAEKPSEAQSRRFAIVIGANKGDADEAVLRHAERDAQRIASILRDLGGFAPQDVRVLNDLTAEGLRRTLIATNRQVRAARGAALLFVFYSGHADAESLHLRGTRLALGELRDLVYGSPAGVRILVIDACRSGAVTRVKGGSPRAAFTIDLDDRLSAEGTATLTSSAAGEESQESDRLRASFFTHYLASALLGAADRDENGRVTLSEAFSYARDRTLAATAATVVGPQHPTFRFNLGGRADLVLTWPGLRGQQYGFLQFAAGSYLVHRDRPEGAIVAEVSVSRGRRKLALEPGRYFVVRRGANHLLQAAFAVRAGKATVVAASAMDRVEYARVVRKGGSDRTSSVSVLATATGRSDLLGLGPGIGAGLSARLDLAPITLEGRAALVLSQTENRRLSIDTRELFLSLAALRAFDAGPVTLSAGLLAGGFRLTQDFHEAQTPNRTSIGFVLGPVGQVDFMAWRRFYARLEVAPVTYFVRTGESAADDRLETPVTVHLSAGVGAFF